MSSLTCSPLRCAPPVATHLITCSPASLLSASDYTTSSFIVQLLLFDADLYGSHKWPSLYFIFKFHDFFLSRYYKDNIYWTPGSFLFRLCCECFLVCCFFCSLTDCCSVQKLRAAVVLHQELICS